MRRALHRRCRKPTTASATPVRRHSSVRNRPAAPPPPISPSPPHARPLRLIEAPVAADILDAARQRVLPQAAVEPQLSTPPAAQPVSTAGIPVVRGDAAAAPKGVRQRVRTHSSSRDDQHTGRLTQTHRSARIIRMRRRPASSAAAGSLRTPRSGNGADHRHRCRRFKRKSPASSAK